MNWLITRQEVQQTSVAPSAERITVLVKEWEIIADNLSKSRWNSGCISVPVTRADSFAAAERENSGCNRAACRPGKNWEIRYHLRPVTRYLPPASRFCCTTDPLYGQPPAPYGPSFAPLMRLTNVVIARLATFGRLRIRSPILISTSAAILVAMAS